MDFLNVLKAIAAIATVATGLLALVKPISIYSFTGLKSKGMRGISEIRSIFGGLFIALGVVPFFLGQPAYLTLGISYLTIAGVRLFSILIDRSYARSNLISLGVEIVLGIILVI